MDGAMPELRLKSQRFRQERETEWRRLEALMDRAESRGPGALTDEELLAVPVLYRATLSSLSVARETSLDRGLVDYLETLSSRAYFFVYGARTTLPERLTGFFMRDWPLAVRALWRETLASALLLVLGGIVAAFLVQANPEWYYSFVDPALASGRDFTASTESLRETLYHDGGRDGLSFFATSLFTHNAQVAIFAFALGFAFCVPTAYLIVTNGAMAGAMLTLFASRGLGFELGGWLAIHGVTELFAIILAGAAGFRIGWAMAFPGDRTRLEAATAAGRTAATAMGGVVVMLFFAGLLEGFGRQLITDDLARYGVAAATGLIWALYFYGPRRPSQETAHGQG